MNFLGEMIQSVVGTHHYVTIIEDECGFTKIKITSNLGYREPWVNTHSIGHVFYHQESEYEDWFYVVDVEGCGSLEAITQSGLGPNELVVASQIKDVGEKIEFKAKQEVVFWPLFSSTSICII